MIPIKMKTFCIIIFIFIFSYIGCVSAKESSIKMNQKDYYYLTEAEIKQYSAKALAGSIKHASKIWEYYAFSEFDYNAASFWEVILCENEKSNNSVGTYNLAIALLEETSYDSKRGWYWLYRCRKSGFTYNSFLEKLYNQIDVHIDNEKCKIDFSKISLINIENYALSGNGDAAYYLYKFYSLQLNPSKEEMEVLNPNMKSSLWWLRVGAQNQNERCQKEYSDILESCTDDYSKIRSQFWKFY